MITGVFNVETVVVIGGGITGLSTMYYLQRAAAESSLDVRLILVEANETLGGKIHTVHDGEFVIETGADSIVVRKEKILSFIKEINLEEKVVYNATGKSFLHTENGLKMIPEDSMFGIPMSVESLATTELISAEGKVEALRDFYVKNERFTKDDSVGEFLESFLGRELLDNQIAPVLSGVYAGAVDDLTIASTLPFLVDYKNKYGSIIRGLEENKEKFKGSSNIKFLSFQNGLSTMINRLEELLIDAVEIKKGASAKKIEKVSERYKILFENDEEIDADYIVLTTPDSIAYQLLLDPNLEEEFHQFKNKSLISIYLGFDIPDGELPKDGTGFIVTKSSGLTCGACTWSSRKWTHTSTNGNLLVRLFYKDESPNYERLNGMSESELEEIALADIQQSLGITGKPVSSVVTKWNDKMPHYHISHSQILQSLEKKMEADYPNILLAGASYYGAGIPDCITNGEETANRIIESLKKED